MRLKTKYVLGSLGGMGLTLLPSASAQTADFSVSDWWSTPDRVLLLVLVAIVVVVGFILMTNQGAATKRITTLIRSYTPPDPSEDIDSIKKTIADLLKRLAPDAPEGEDASFAANLARFTLLFTSTKASGEALLAESIAAKAEAERLRNELAAITLERDTHKTDLVTVRETLAATETERDTHKGDLETTRAALAAAETERDTHKSNLLAAATEAEHANAARQRAEEDRRKAEDARAKTETAYRSLRSHMEQVATVHRNADQVLKEADKDDRNDFHVAA